MRKAWRYFSIFIRAIWRVVFDYFAWILPYSRHPERYPLAQRYAKGRALVRFILKKMKFNFEIDGLEQLIPQEPCLFIANHVGAVDPLIHIAISPRPVSFVAKIEATKIPIVGRFIRAIDGVFLDRDDPFQAVRVFREAVNLMRADGVSFVIFPEGTRQKQPYSAKANEFHPGSFKIASMAKCPIYLYAQFGSFHAFGNQKGRNHLVQIRFLRRFEASEVAELRSVILSSQSLMLIDEAYPRLVQADRNYEASGKTKEKAPKWWESIE